MSLSRAVLSRTLSALLVLGATGSGVPIDLWARENMKSCSADGNGRPNPFGVCVEFTGNPPAFYCNEEMHISYIRCSTRNRVGSCEMKSDSGPFLVHYYAPQRNGASLPSFCAQHGIYHAPESGYTLSLPPEPERTPNPEQLLNDTKKVSEWKEDRQDSESDMSCSADGEGRKSARGICVEFRGETPGDLCAGAKTGRARCAASERLGVCRIEKEGRVFFVHLYAPADPKPACLALRGTLFPPNIDYTR